MKVFVAGTTGVLGRQAVSALVAAGHRVTGVARTKSKADVVRGMGAEPVAVEVFDADAVKSAVVGHEVVCNFATKIPATATGYWRRSAWKTNDRLHAEASRHLVDAALAAGAGHYLQHGAAFQYADGGDEWLDEDARIDPPPHGESLLEAENEARRFSDAGGAGVTLRFGFFYGPDAPTARNLIRVARMGFVPMAGRGEAFVPWIYTEDLGTSTIAALTAPGGAYNVVDDEPTTRAVLGEVLAEALGRKRLRISPRGLNRVVPDRYGYVLRSQRVSNTKLRNATGWSPSVPTCRVGWPRMLAAPA